MKQLKILTIVSLLILLNSCDFLAMFKGEEDNDGGSSYSYSFVDQDLQGTHSGESWTFVAGYADDWFDNEISINLFDVSHTDGMLPSFSISYNYENKVWITVPNQIGLYEINSSISVNLSNQAGTIDKNLTAGAIEITEIDTVNGTISGKIDCCDSSDKSNYHITGNFTVPYYPD